MFGRTITPEISPSEAHARADGYVLLDVREPAEWAAGHAPGALHLPLGELDPARLSRSVTFLCVCRSGNRSGRAVATLRDAGFEAVNVAGGMQAWWATGLPVVRDDGRPGAVA